MITAGNTSHPISFKGLSSDTKPTSKWGDIDIWNGDTFLEMDTGEVYFFDGDSHEWISPSGGMV